MKLRNRSSGLIKTDHEYEMKNAGNCATKCRYPSLGLAFSLRIVLVLAALAIMGCPSMPGQESASQVAQDATIGGTVRNTAGKAMAGVTVRLKLQSDPTEEAAKTDAKGEFTVDGLKAGTYSLTVEHAGLRSADVKIDAIVPGARRHVDLKWDESTAAPVINGSQDSSKTPASAMEFADKPNFTVAAVTDWTAAGGHGSDANLRASEALNREIIGLRPEGSNAKTASPPDKTSNIERSLHADLDKSPGSFEANHKLGEFYLQEGKSEDAVSLLQAAYDLNPKDSDNEYDLARALKAAGKPAKAREHVEKLLALKDTADLHRIAGDLDEELGDPLTAVHQFETTVREEPSEENYFAWGSELLLHRAIWQAKDVFTSGVKAYPKSARLLTALGAALFAGALYDDAAKRLCEASDLNPTDSQPYLFMGKIEMAAPNPLPCIEQKLARFMELHPDDASANYFYAMTYWKQHGHSDAPRTLEEVHRILIKAVTVDPKCSDAYLQLGILETERREYEKAIGYYTKAIEIDPQLSAAYYRLGVAYDRTGEKEKAQQQFQLHDQIEKAQAAEVYRQRREVKQFLVVVDGKSSASQQAQP